MLKAIKNYFVRVRANLLTLSKAVQAFGTWVRAGVVYRRNLLDPEGNMRLDFRGYFQHLLENPERGAISTKMLESILVGAIIVTLIITYVMQQGGPMILEATSNTTALENAGATSNQISMATWIGGAIFIVLLVSVIVVGFRAFLGGGGGGVVRRWRRKR